MITYFKNVIIELHILYVLNMYICQISNQSNIIYYSIHKIP